MTLFGVGNDHHQSGVIPSTPKREYEEAGDAGRRGCGCATPHMTQLMSTTAPSQPPRASKQVLGLQHVIHTLFAARHPKSPTTQRYKNYVSPHAHQLAFSSSSKPKTKPNQNNHIRKYITQQTIKHNTTSTKTNQQINQYGILLQQAHWWTTRWRYIESRQTRCSQTRLQFPLLWIELLPLNTGTPQTCLTTILF